MQRLKERAVSALVRAADIAGDVLQRRMAAETLSRGARVRPPRAPTKADLAFLSPLGVGTIVEGAEVTRVGGIERGLLHVDVRLEAHTFHLAIGLARQGIHAPRAGRYAVYLWEQDPPPEAFPVAEALARALRTQADRDPPPGMTDGEFGEAP